MLLTSYWRGYTPDVDLDYELGPFALSVLLCELDHTERCLLEAGLTIPGVIKQVEHLYSKDYGRTKQAALLSHALHRTQSSLSTADCPTKSPVARIGRVLGFALAPSLKKIGSGTGFTLTEPDVSPASNPPVVGSMPTSTSQASPAGWTPKQIKRYERARVSHEMKNAKRVGEGKEPFVWLNRRHE